MPRRKKEDELPPDQKGPPRCAANARERTRMRVLSKAFGRLKLTLPWVPPDTKLSKLDTLRLATSYISHLRRILHQDDSDEDSSLKVYNLGHGGLLDAVSSNMTSTFDQQQEFGDHFLDGNCCFHMGKDPQTFEKQRPTNVRSWPPYYDQKPHDDRLPVLKAQPGDPGPVGQQHQRLQGSDLQCHAPPVRSSSSSSSSGGYSPYEATQADNQRAPCGLVITGFYEDPELPPLQGDEALPSRGHPAPLLPPYSACHPQHHRPPELFGQDLHHPQQSGAPEVYPHQDLLTLGSTE